MKRFFKRTLATIMVVFMLLTLIPLGDFNLNITASAASENSNHKFIEEVSQKSYVPSGYTGIYTATDLHNIRNNVSGKYILMNDIDLVDYGKWESFNVSGITLDGNGFSIINLYSETYGLFIKSFGQSTILNLGLENIVIQSTKSNVGGFVGAVEYSDGGTLKILNCFVTGCIEGGYCTGGFVGLAYWNDKMQISKCYNFADITADDSSVGGIVGEISSWQYETNVIEKSLNKGRITGTSCVGGIIGSVSGYGDQVENTISQCCNYGMVTGSKNNIGGICGEQTNTYASVDIVDCYNVGDVKGFANIGGICGKSDSFIEHTYNIGFVNGSSDYDALVGLGSTDSGSVSVKDSYYNNIFSSKYGTGLSQLMMKSSLNFLNFDFSSIWDISYSVNFGHPYLIAHNNLKWAFNNEVTDFNTLNKKYIEQHIDFINSSTYNKALNSRYSTFLWENYYNKWYQTGAEFAYDIIEGTYEVITFSAFDGLESIQNQYDVILKDLISNAQTGKKIYNSLELNINSSLTSTLNDFIQVFQPEDDWLSGLDVQKELSDLFILKNEQKDYSSNTLYKKLASELNGKSEDDVNKIFNKFSFYNDVLKYVNDGLSAIEYFIEIANYISVIEAYLSTTEGFKTVLNQISDTMPNVNKNYGKDFQEALSHFTSCMTEEDVINNVLEHMGKEAILTSFDMCKDVFQNIVKKVLTKSLKMAEASAAKLVAGFWAYEKGFELANLITNNDTSVNCRRLLRALYMMDEATYAVLLNSKNQLSSNNNFKNALLFDSSFNIFKNIQLYSLQVHYDYLEANASSLFNFVFGSRGKYDSHFAEWSQFKTAWELIQCHNVETTTNTKTEFVSTDIVVVACPTNVYVYDEHMNLVASVINNEIAIIGNSVFVYELNSVKTVCIPDIDKYQIFIDSYDSGEMEVSLTDLKGENSLQTISFEDVSIKDDDRFVCHFDTSNNNAEKNSYLIKNDVSEVYPTSTHAHIYSDWKFLVKPTCETTGMINRECSQCGKIETQETVATGHNYKIVLIEPTCTKKGQTKYVCFCGESNIEEIPQIAQNCNVRNNLLFGLKQGVTADELLSNFLVSDTATITLSNDVIGTGTLIEITNGDGICEELEVVIFGDVDGDGQYNGQDAIVVSSLVTGLLTKENVNPAVYAAADCNSDGKVNEQDVELLYSAGLLIKDVEQSNMYDDGSGTINVTFVGNGATDGAMENQRFLQNEEQALNENQFVRSYKVNYELDGGSATITEANTDSIYTFTSWNSSKGGNGLYGYSNGQSVVNPNGSAGGNVYLYAQWTGGEIEIPTPTKEGYRFIGWFTDEDFENEFTETIYSPIEDMTLYAKWEIEKYEVTFNNFYENEFDFDSYDFSSAHAGTVSVNEMDESLILRSTGVDTYILNYTDLTKGYMELIPGHTYRFSYKWENISDVDETLHPYAFAYNSLEPSELQVYNYYILSAPAQTSGVHSFMETVPEGHPYVTIRLGVSGREQGGSVIKISDICVQDITDSTGMITDYFGPYTSSSIQIHKVSVEYGTLISSADDLGGSLPTMTRMGYTFAGWFDSYDETGNGTGTQYVETSVIGTTDLKLYARWIKK